MTVDAVAVWPRVNQRQKSARVRKDEAPSRHVEMKPAVQALERPVATFVVDGQEIVLTENDMAAVRAQLTRPRSEEVIQVLALADKIGALRRHLPPQVRERLFWENVEAIRTQAIADGTAIDDPMEAVVGD